MSHVLLCAVTALGLSLLAASAGAQVSELWGRDGERWQPGGRLPDFSHAGYRRGEAAIPDVAVASNIRDFGAVGDGTHDDTAAFRRAVAEAPAGAIEIPPGRYLITDIIEIRRAGIVLRGAGADKTTIYLPKTLHEVRPNMAATTDGRPTSNYSWSGGFFWFRGDYRSAELAKVTAPAKLGDTTVAVSTTQGLTVGQTVEIAVRDTEAHTLANHLYAGQPGDTSKLKGSTRASLTARITGIENGQVTIDRALRFDLQPEWQPRLLRFEPTVTECGIENLRFEFPVTPYEGHFTELGFNPLAFNSVAHCWARNIVIDDCDSGLFPGGRYCTFSDITFNSKRPPDKGNNTGHHGIYLGGDDNLFTRFNFNGRFIHDISVSHCAGNVISAGRGVDVCFDHHKRAPYANLYTDIDLGEGSRMYMCGGGDALGKHSGARETFWNIRARRTLAWPKPEFGPDLMNLVGLHTKDPAAKDPQGKWFEPIPPAQLVPANLHEAQLRRRLQPGR